jgi:hypothetical protein
VGGDVEQTIQGFTAVEALVMWFSAALICGIVVFGGNRWVGIALLCLYIRFLVFEVSSGRILDD